MAVRSTGVRRTLKLAQQPERLDEEELADWRAGRNAVYQLAALTIGASRSPTGKNNPEAHWV